MARKKRSVVRRQPKSIISDEIVIPNLSGDHSAGKTGTPASDLDIANKKYVDDNTHTKYTDAEAVTAVSDDDSYVKNDGDIMTGELEIKYTDAVLKINGDATNSNPMLRFIETTDGWNMRHKGSDNSLRFSNILGGTDWFNMSAQGVLTLSEMNSAGFLKNTSGGVLSGGNTIDHTADILNVGTNTHAQLDTHLALTDEHIDWTGASAGTIHATNYVDNNTQNVKGASITVENPDATEDILIFFTNKAITISEMRAVLGGSSSPSVTWKIRHHTDRNNAGNAVVTAGTTTTSITTGSDVTSFDDATIPIDSFVWLETTAKSGTVTELHVTLVFSED